MAQYIKLSCRSAASDLQFYCTQRWVHASHRQLNAATVLISQHRNLTIKQ